MSWIQIVAPLFTNAEEKGTLGVVQGAISSILGLSVWVAGYEVATSVVQCRGAPLFKAFWAMPPAFGLRLLALPCMMLSQKSSFLAAEGIVLLLPSWARHVASPLVWLRGCGHSIS